MVTPLQLFMTHLDFALYYYGWYGAKIVVLCGLSHTFISNSSHLQSQEDTCPTMVLWETHPDLPHLDCSRYSSHP